MQGWWILPYKIFCEKQGNKTRMTKKFCSFPCWMAGSLCDVLGGKMHQVSYCGLLRIPPQHLPLQQGFYTGTIKCELGGGAYSHQLLSAGATLSQHLAGTWTLRWNGHCAEMTMLTQRKWFPVAHHVPNTKDLLNSFIVWNLLWLVVNRFLWVSRSLTPAHVWLHRRPEPVVAQAAPLSHIPLHLTHRAWSVGLYTPGMASGFFTGQVWSVGLYMPGSASGLYRRHVFQHALPWAASGLYKLQAGPPCLWKCRPCQCQIRAS